MNRRIYSALAGSIMLCACAVGPDFKSPAAPPDGPYTPTPIPERTAAAPGVAGDAQEFEMGRDIPAQWWTLFHSEGLDAMVRAALAQSPTLGAAQATLREARENLSARKGELYPSVDLQGSTARERVSGVTLGEPGFSEELTVINAAVSASYNPDVFGGIRRQIESDAAQVDYQNYQLEATYLTLTSSVAATAIKEASLRAQIQATADVLKAEDRELSVVQRQYDVGAIPRSTLLQQQTQVATTRATLPALQKMLDQTRHQLSVLVGRLPGEGGLPEFSLDGLKLPPELPVSLPSALVRQRPDILASEAQLHVASAQVGVATANLYPQFTLTAQYGRESIQWSNLFGPQNTFWSLIGGVTQPLFRGGTLTAERRAAVAGYDVAANQYRATVLGAFQNVADSLRALDSDAQSLVAYQETDALAHRTLDLTQVQYKLGAVSYVALLDAQRQYDQAHLNLVQAQAARLNDTVALFQSLGGGWWNRAAPLDDISKTAVGDTHSSEQ